MASWNGTAIMQGLEMVVRMEKMEACNKLLWIKNENIIKQTKKSKITYWIFYMGTEYTISWLVIISYHL